MEKSDLNNPKKITKKVDVFSEEECKKRAEQLYQKAQESEKGDTPMSRARKARSVIKWMAILQNLRHRKKIETIDTSYTDIVNYTPILDFHQEDYDDKDYPFVIERMTDFEIFLAKDNPVLKFQIYQIIDEELNNHKLRNEMRKTALASRERVDLSEQLDDSDKRLLELSKAVGLHEKDRKEDGRDKELAEMRKQFELRITDIDKSVQEQKEQRKRQIQKMLEEKKRREGA